MERLSAGDDFVFRGYSCVSARRFGCYNCKEGLASTTSKEKLLTTLQVRDCDKEKDYLARNVGCVVGE